MPKNYVSNSRESVRMFRNDFIERLSKVHFSIPLFIYVPVIAYFLWHSQQQFHPGLVLTLAYFAGGWLSWSLAEYLIHRFIFHFHPKGPRAQRIHFVFHGVHHAYPNDERRLVMPPSASIPLAVLFYFLFSWLLPAPWLSAFFSGFVAGYLVYDMAHYALHHFHFRSSFFKRLKRHHMLHHYQNENRRYGVSSGLWDKIFRSN